MTDPSIKELQSLYDSYFGEEIKQERRASRRLFCLIFGIELIVIGGILAATI